MRIKKVVLMLIVVLLSSACTANYDLEFKNNKLIEHTEISSINPINEEKKEYEKYGKYYITSIVPKENYGFDVEPLEKINGLSYYNRNLNIGDNIYKLTYDYTFTTKNYRKSFLGVYANEYFNFLEKNDSYVISTSKEFKIFDDYDNLDEIDIHIKSNHKLINTNADRVDGYNYYWSITDKADKGIYLEVSKNDKIFNYENEFYITLMIIAAIILVILIIGLHLYRKSKKLSSF